MERELNLAVIGLGSRAASLISVLQRVCSGFNLAGVVDPDEIGVLRNLHTRGVTGQSPRFFPGTGHLLEEAERFDGILIGTRCNLHTEVAVSVAGTGLPVYIEKPVAVTRQQILDLRRAYSGRESTVVVSFPLRSSPLFKKVLEIVDSGRVGTINQVQAVNNVPYGAVYFGSPTYRDHDVTGGLWLQKATHDFDYINLLLNSPTAITAMATRSVYGGDMPNDLWCSDCTRADACRESPQGLERSGNELVRLGDHKCVWGEGIRHQDSGSALIMYENGVHASYSQNFVTRGVSATRGAVITGYEATVSFDWYTDRVKVSSHFDDDVEEYLVRVSANGHQGGDEALMRNFVDVCMGRDGSHSDLSAGMLSAAMCLAARESTHSRAQVQVPDIISPDFPGTSGVPFTISSDIEPMD